MRILYMLYSLYPNNNIGFYIFYLFNYLGTVNKILDTYFKIYLPGIKILSILKNNKSL